MADIWMGDTTYKKASREGHLKIVGDRLLTRNITDWMANSIFTDLPSADNIIGPPQFDYMTLLLLGDQVGDLFVSQIPKPD